jgi:hypothetical protein
VLQECKFSGVLVTERLIEKLNVLQIEGHIFHSQTKNKSWGLYVIALLDFSFLWHFALDWVTGSSQFNLYKQSYTVLR